MLQENGFKTGYTSTAMFNDGENEWLNDKKMTMLGRFFTQNILSKSVEELRVLKEHGLNLFYYGIETGDDELLKKINKGVNSYEIIKSLEMTYEANIKVSANVILGL